jgi:hypothetical protein
VGVAFVCLIARSISLCRKKKKRDVPGYYATACPNPKP